MVGSGCSVLLYVCYADNNNSSHPCQIMPPLLFPLTHLLCIPSICHFSCLSTHEPFPHHFALCVHSILQIIPHHPILLYLFLTLLFSMMKNLVTLYKGLLKSPNWCLSPPLSLSSLSILLLRLGNCFQKRLWSNLSLQPRLQCYPSCMVQLGRFLVFLPLHLHPISIKQVTPKYFFFLFFFYISPSVIELHRVFTYFVGFFFQSV